MSSGMVFLEANHLSAAAIRDGIAQVFGEAVELAADAGTDVAGPARYYRLADSGRRFGIISAMTEHFCDTCNRVRLTSVGDLHTCLGFDDATSLRPLLRGEASDDDIRVAIEAAVQGKREGHTFEVSGIGGPRKHMVSIGG